MQRLCLRDRSQFQRISERFLEILGVSCGDRITFIVENGNVRLINSAVYAMQILQTQMTGEAEKTGLDSDEAVMDMVKEIRTNS